MIRCLLCPVVARRTYTLSEYFDEHIELDLYSGFISRFKR